jgi:hypothetical protein
VVIIKPRLNIGKEKMMDKIKSMKKSTLLIIAFFVIVVIANMLGYGG